MPGKGTGPVDGSREKGQARFCEKARCNGRPADGALCSIDLKGEVGMRTDGIGGGRVNRRHSSEQRDRPELMRRVAPTPLCGGGCILFVLPPKKKLKIPPCAESADMVYYALVRPEGQERDL